MKKYKVKIKRNHPRVEAAISAWKDEATKRSDILGWYTGMPSGKNDIRPEQDNDDL